LSTTSTGDVVIRLLARCVARIIRNGSAAIEDIERASADE
jgi:hypothetical protein